MFRFRLARLLGCTVAELGHRLTVAEFREWAEYYTIEPWGERGGNWQTAIIGSLLLRALAGKSSKVTAAKLMPGRRETPKQTAEEMQREFLAAVALE